MSRVQEIQSKISDATAKLNDRQNDVKYWIDELKMLNRDLERAQQEETQQAAKKGPTY